MKIIRNIIVAFSMYSRIPMPVFEWKEDDTKYAIGFIGLIGAVIGLLEGIALVIGLRFGLPVFVEASIFTVIPLIVTGGFHVDGFMDVQDACNSYKPMEEKLKILKDPHIGAFSVISLAIYGCIFMASAYLLFNACSACHFIIAFTSFMLLRSLGGLISIAFKHSKQNGMLHEETKKADNITKGILIVMIALSVVIMLLSEIITAAIIALALTLFIFYFKNKCEKQFGGISGDTIGYFITEGELIVLMVTAALAFL